MAYYLVEHPDTCICCCFAAAALGSVPLPSGTLLSAKSSRLLNKGLTLITRLQKTLLLASLMQI